MACTAAAAAACTAAAAAAAAAAAQIKTHASVNFYINIICVHLVKYLCMYVMYVCRRPAVAAAAPDTSSGTLTRSSGIAGMLAVCVIFVCVCVCVVCV